MMKIFKIVAITLLNKLSLIFPDRIYLKMQFRLRMGYRLDLDNPKTFSEKIQWLKIHDRNPRYTNLVDKYEVKSIVGQKIGAEHIIETIWVWDTVEEISFDRLPKQFVLKTTHGGGNSGVVICKDKGLLDRNKTIKLLKHSLSQDIFKDFREWPYKNVRRRIIAEQYMEQEDGSHLIDYKFFCFNGNPRFVYVSQYSDTSKKTISCFFSMEWEKASFGRADDSSDSIAVPKPKTFELMKSIAIKLSKDTPLVRVDLYEINKQVYFSELTFYPSSGMQPFKPLGWDKRLGEMLVLPSIN